MHLKNEYLEPQNEVLKFIDDAMNRNKRRRKVEYIKQNLYIVGVCKRFNFNSNVIRALGEFFQKNAEIFSFQRLLKNGIMYESSSYCENKLSDNSCIMYDLNGKENLGIIHSFIKIFDQNLDEFKFYAIVIECVHVTGFRCEFLKSDLKSIFLFRQRTNCSMISIDIEKIKSICFKINIGDLMFAVKPANIIEFE